jgi:hypothetical protein
MSATAIPHSRFSAPGAGTLAGAPIHDATPWLRRAVGVAGDVLLMTAVVLCVPFVILAIGTPIALFVQLVLWMVRLL